MKKQICIIVIIVGFMKFSTGYAWELPTWGQIKTWFTPTYFKEERTATTYPTNVTNAGTRQPVIKSPRQRFKDNILKPQERLALKRNYLVTSKKAIPYYSMGIDTTEQRRQQNGQYNLEKQKDRETSQAQFKKAWNDTPLGEQKAKHYVLVGRDLPKEEENGQKSGYQHLRSDNRIKE